MIQVTQTFLPPIEEYQAFVQRAYDKQWLTNRGELVLELENKLRNFLSVSNILLTSNGTVPLQIALKLLGNQGEIITTPFSYVATTASIKWQHCVPVFVDIDPEYLTIDEKKIEAAITEKTTAILATHVFGNPCNVEAIESIAKKHHLSVIYDGAHSFGVKYKNESIFNYGNVSTSSFHATKLFHTGEGGAIFCRDEELMRKIYYSHNFGHNGPLEFHGLGINGKISELQAAMGLALLPYFENILTERKKVVDYYNDHLSDHIVQKIQIRRGTDWNYSYYPVVFNDEQQLLKIQSGLNAQNIFPRRYFYPSLNTLDYVKYQSMAVSESIALRIMCLPLYVGLKPEELEGICKVINTSK
ncbi:MAG: DegT/DnrJ/EryC1/StrS family aminotransferase [Bacteroidota bacterium]|nr:DegT/DnrJ/EryC1/StrS family aminotransferase [Bacteroidota bacterium]